MANIARKFTTTRFLDLLITETRDLPASAVREYGAAFEVKSGPNNARYIHGWLQASTVTGTNLDIGLYGADTLTGTKRELKDALVADITDNTLAKFVIDLKPNGMAPFLFLAWLADGDESANTIAYGIFIPNEN